MGGIGKLRSSVAHVGVPSLILFGSIAATLTALAIAISPAAVTVAKGRTQVFALIGKIRRLDGVTENIHFKLPHQLRSVAAAAQ